MALIERLRTLLETAALDPESVDTFLEIMTTHYPEHLAALLPPEPEPEPEEHA